ncbi:MAG: hypothetical protein Q4B42_04540 [Oscillospiraceae bacterium]|nr:hypothetical protein [Oscillospiraceae bacterium]
MKTDDYDPIFDYNSDGKLDLDESLERELFEFGDGSMTEPGGVLGGLRAEALPDSGVFDEFGDPIDPDDLDLYDEVYDEFGDPIRRGGALFDDLGGGDFDDFDEDSDEEF